MEHNKIRVAGTQMNSKWYCQILSENSLWDQDMLMTGGQTSQLSEECAVLNEKHKRRHFVWYSWLSVCRDSVDLTCLCLQEVKKVGNEAKLQDDTLRKKFSLDVDLVAENKDDARVAELLQFSTVESKL